MREKPESIQLGLTLVCLLAFMATVASASEASECVNLKDPAMAHEQLMSLSRAIDPSGKLGKIISDFHPPGDSHHMAASELVPTIVEPVKRSAEPEPINSTTTPVGPTTTSNPGSSSIEPTNTTTASPSTTPAKAVSSTTVAPGVQSNASEASNVAVNVFLQLAPDPKTEELINNPDKAIPSSTTTTSTTTTTTTTAAPSSSSSTVPPESSSVAKETTQASSTTTTTTQAPSNGTQASRRRRRRSADHANHKHAPAPSTTSSTTTTSTSTTTTPKPTPPSTTTTTTTTEAPSSTTGAPATTTTASSTTTANERTFQVQGKDIKEVPVKPETSVEATSSKVSGDGATMALPVQIVFDSKSASPSPSPASTSTSSPAPAPTTSSTTTTTTAAPPASSSTTSAPVTSSTTTLAPAPPSAAPPIPSASNPTGMKADGETEIIKAPKPTESMSSSIPGQLSKVKRNETYIEQPRKRTVESVNITSNEKPLGPTISAGWENLNVIFDGETTNVELNPIQSTSSNESSMPTSVTLEAQANGEGRKTAINDGFINGDHIDEIERENHATCRMVLIQNITDEREQANFFGRLNFWQPVNNSGVMHLVARIQYSQSLTFNHNHTISKRESFRAPVERPPAEGIPADKAISRLLNKHQIWLVQSCNSYKKLDSLLAELTPTPQVTPNATTSDKLVNFDVELVVAHYNLTESNEIADRYLIFQLPNGKTLACCQVNLTENPPINELDGWSSVSMVQPVREDLLPSRLRESPVSG